MTETERSSRRVQQGRNRQRHIISHSSPININHKRVTRTSNMLLVVVVYAGLLLVGLSLCPTVSAWALPSARRIVTLPSRSPQSLPFSRGPLYQAISAASVSTPSSNASTTATTTTSSSSSSSSTSPVTSHPGENDEEGNSAARRWLGILSKGSKKKGVSDVKLREAEELGGLPRSDRYSSRYVRSHVMIVIYHLPSDYRKIPPWSDGRLMPHLTTLCCFSYERIQRLAP